MTRLLVLSFYYPPDLSAGSFRCKALIEAIDQRRGADLQVDVITTLPNRYKELNVAAPKYEEQDWLTIRRIALPSHRSGIGDQAWAFLLFAISAVRMMRGREYDAVFATSSRLMTAALGAAISRRKKSRLYLDIRDLFVDTISDILSEPLKRWLMPFFRRLEKWTFAQAEAISIVSAAFEPYVKSIANSKKIWLFTNGIDPEFLDQSFSNPNSASKPLPTILYAGNLGEGQGLEHVLPKAAAVLMGKANFKVIGGGGRLEQLKATTAELNNVEILPPVNRAALMDHYRDAEILLLHLNDHQAFQKVLPSKLFEYAATGKPIIAGVSGYAANFIHQHIPGAYVFTPLHSAGLAKAMQNAASGPPLYVRAEFCSKFARTKLMSDMAGVLLSDIMTIES